MSPTRQIAVWAGIEHVRHHNPQRIHFIVCVYVCRRAQDDEIAYAVAARQDSIFVIRQHQSIASRPMARVISITLILSPGREGHV